MILAQHGDPNSVPAKQAWGRMRDILMFVAFFAACAAVGAPLCLLLPQGRFRARFTAAPPIGFALLGVATTVGYLHGIAPAQSAAIAATLGLSIFVFASRRLGNKLDGVSGSIVGAAVVVAFLCLSPAWTGGPQFTVFQGNVYDQFGSYLTGSVVFRNHDYAAVVAEAARDDGSTIFRRALWHLENRGAVSIVHVALARLIGGDTIGSSYAYVAAMQANMFFAAVFVALNVFAASRAVALLVAAALTLGFLEQNIIDINAWSQLSTQPLFLLFIGIVVIAFEPGRFGDDRLHAVLRIGGLSTAVAAGLLYLYPEGLTVYGFAAAAASAVAILTRPGSDATKIALAGLGLGAGLTLLAGAMFWDGTAAYVVRQLSRNAFHNPNWWTYYHRHLLGAEHDYVSYLIQHPPLGEAAFAIFSLPIDALAGALGLHFILPSANWPRFLAFAWKLMLSGYLGILFWGVVRSVMLIRREGPRAAQLMIVASLASLMVPASLWFKSFHWSAGKGLMMAIPLIFFVAVLPLLVRNASLVARGACLLLVGGHLLLGLLRPIMAADPSGMMLAGLPVRPMEQKVQLDWDHQRWAAELRNCREVALDIEEPIMQMLARMELTDMGISWSSRGTQPFANLLLKPYREAQWAQADCLATTAPGLGRPGQTVIHLNKDRALAEFVDGRRTEVELATRYNSGLLMRGFYALEKAAAGPLRWSSADARLEVPNEKAASMLSFSVWPMPLASGARMRIAVNDQVLFDDAVPAGQIDLPLGEFAKAAQLAITVHVEPATRFRGDPRELGVPLKTLALRR